MAPNRWHDTPGQRLRQLLGQTTSISPGQGQRIPRQCIGGRRTVIDIRGNVLPGGLHPNVSVRDDTTLDASG